GIRRKIEAGNGIRLVLRFSQARRAGIRWPLRERIDRRALRVAFAARQSVSVHRNEQRRLAPPRESDSLAKWNETVVGAGHSNPVLAGFFNFVAHQQTEFENDRLLHLAARRSGAIV